MPRRGRITRREAAPDPLFHSGLATQFVNTIMRQGNKSVAEGIFYNAIKILDDKTAGEGLKTFKKAVDNVKPVLEVKSRRVGGSTYQVPIEVDPNRRQSLSIRWLLTYARLRGEKTMQERLASELLDAASNRGASIKKKEDTHKMAEANKAFAHYRW